MNNPKCYPSFLKIGNHQVYIYVEDTNTCVLPNVFKTQSQQAFNISK